MKRVPATRAIRRSLIYVGKRCCARATARVPFAEFGRAVGVDTDAGEPLSSSPTLERTFRRFHEAYLGAASALERLGRDEQAEEALTMAASTNTSTLEPHVRLARVRRRRGDEKGASEAIRHARRTFSELPSFLKRRQLGWWARTLI